jgi:hypothetical protein
MTSAQPTSSLFVLASRVFWMMVGPMMLAILALSIVRIGTSWFTPADFAFLVVLGLVLLARWVEFRGGNPQTAAGEPATPDHLRRYVVITLALGLGVWIVANLVGNYWLGR